MAPTIAAPIAARVRLAPVTGEEIDYFRTSGADLKAMHEEGDEAAGAEIARRKANRAAKSEAKKAAAAAA